MAKYLLAYHGGGMPQNPEEQQRVLAAWGKWYQDLGQAIVDGGNPIGQTRVIASDGSVSSDGHSSPVSGYTIIEAGSLDKAVELAKGCPILESGGSIEVGETFNVM